MEDQTLSVCLFQKQMQAMAQKHPVHHFSYWRKKSPLYSWFFTRPTESVSHSRQHSGLVLLMGWAFSWQEWLWVCWISSALRGSRGAGWNSRVPRQWESLEHIFSLMGRIPWTGSPAEGRNPSLASSVHCQTWGAALLSPEQLCRPCSATASFSFNYREGNVSTAQLLLSHWSTSVTEHRGKGAFSTQLIISAAFWGECAQNRGVI